MPNRRSRNSRRAHTGHRYTAADYQLDLLRRAQNQNGQNPTSTAISVVASSSVASHGPYPLPVGPLVDPTLRVGTNSSHFYPPHTQPSVNQSRLLGNGRGAQSTHYNSPYTLAQQGQAANLGHGDILSREAPNQGAGGSGRATSSNPVAPSFVLGRSLNLGEQVHRVNATAYGTGGQALRMSDFPAAETGGLDNIEEPENSSEDSFVTDPFPEDGMSRPLHSRENSIITNPHEKSPPPNYNQLEESRATRHGSASESPVVSNSYVESEPLDEFPQFPAHWPGPFPGGSNVKDWFMESVNSSSDAASVSNWANFSRGAAAVSNLSEGREYVPQIAFSPLDTADRRCSIFCPSASDSGTNELVVGTNLPTPSSIRTSAYQSSFPTFLGQHQALRKSSAMGVEVTFASRHKQMQFPGRFYPSTITGLGRPIHISARDYMRYSQTLQITYALFDSPLHSPKTHTGSREYRASFSQWFHTGKQTIIVQCAATTPLCTGVYFGPGSEHNRYQVDHNAGQDDPTLGAEINAVRQAIDTARAVFHGLSYRRAPFLTKIIVLTSSERVVRGMTEFLPIWNEMGWAGLDGLFFPGAEGNKKKWEMLDLVIELAADAGLEVDLWLVGSEEVSDAMEWAEVGRRRYLEGKIQEMLDCEEHDLIVEAGLGVVDGWSREV